MSTNAQTNQKNKPSMIAFHVEGEGENARWTEIGAVWPHQDGKGINLKLKFIPTGWDGTITCREPKEEKSAQKQKETQSA